MSECLLGSSNVEGQVLVHARSRRMLMVAVGGVSSHRLTNMEKENFLKISKFLLGEDSEAMPVQKRVPIEGGLFLGAQLPLK